MQNISNKMLLWREFVRFFLILFRVLLLLGGKSYLERLKRDDVRKGIVSYWCYLSRSAPH